MDQQISPKSPLFFFHSSLSWPPDSTQLLHSNSNIDSEADLPSSTTARFHQVEQFVGRLNLYLLLFWFQSGTFKGCNLTFALSESGWIYWNLKKKILSCNIICLLPCVTKVYKRGLWGKTDFLQIRYWTWIKNVAWLQPSTVGKKETTWVSLMNPCCRCDTMDSLRNSNMSFQST